MDDYLSKQLNGGYWLILLNLEINLKWDIAKLWNNASKIICTDGAVGRLQEYSEARCLKLRKGPDYVIGDMDSLQESSLNWLELEFGAGSFKLVHENSDDCTDFEKALNFISQQTDSYLQLLGLNFCGGRLDHTLAILNSACLTDLNVILLNEACAAQVIKESLFEMNSSELVGATCGILPLFGPINVQTDGLRWNVDGELKFQSKISTSNAIIADKVGILNRTNVPYIWTFEIKQ